MKYILILFTIIFCIGCAAEPTFVVDPSSMNHLHYVVKASSKEDNNFKNALRHAINEWQDRTNSAVQFNLYIEDLVEDIIPEETNTIFIMKRALESTKVGRTFRSEDSSRIYIDETELDDTEDIASVIMHELGHAMRLKHIDGDTAIMTPQISTEHLKNADIVEFCRVWNCKYYEER